MLSINIIGAGKLGQILGRLWAQTGVYQIHGILNQSLNSSQAAVDFIGQGQAINSFKALPPADFMLIAVPDGKIEAVIQALYQDYDCPKQQVIFHCAGALHAEILKHPTRSDLFLAAVHPIYSFKPSITAEPNLNGSLCGIEACPKTRIMLDELFSRIGAKTFSLKQNKALYHAGCVFASNYLVSLADQAIACLTATEMSLAESRECIYQLMQNTLDNLRQHPTPLEALTGPIQRGDKMTIEQHLAALAPGPQKILYQAHGLALTQSIQAQDELLSYFQE